MCSTDLCMLILISNKNFFRHLNSKNSFWYVNIMMDGRSVSEATVDVRVNILLFIVEARSIFFFYLFNFCSTINITIIRIYKTKALSLQNESFSHYLRKDVIDLLCCSAHVSYPEPEPQHLKFKLTINLHLWPEQVWFFFVVFMAFCAVLFISFKVFSADLLFKMIIFCHCIRIGAVVWPST